MGSRDAGKSLDWPIYGVKIAFLGSGYRFPGFPSQPFGNRMAKDHLVGIIVWAFFRASALILSRRCSNCFLENLILKTKQPAGSGGLFRFLIPPNGLSRADWGAACEPHQAQQPYWCCSCWRVWTPQPSPQRFFLPSFGFWSSRRPLRFRMRSKRSIRPSPTSGSRRSRSWRSQCCSCPRSSHNLWTCFCSPPFP